MSTPAQNTERHGDFRHVAYGYRHDEVPLPYPGEQKEDSEIRLNPQAEILDLGSRPAIAVSAGCHIEGVTLPHCDPKDPDTMMAGVQKRFNAKPPKAWGPCIEALRSRVRAQLESGRFGDRISSDCDVSFDTWITAAPYSEARKLELRKVYEDLVDISSDKRNFFNKSFGKDEHYTDWKHERGINSRSDAFKVFSGPIFKVIEKRVFAAPEFIKKIPCSERAKYIMDRLYCPGSKYFNSDYTSFEALFVKALMDAVEFEMYRYFAADCFPEWMTAVDEALKGENVCMYKWFTVLLQATRMSGDMCTSLGNGFSNLMFMEFVCEMIGSVCLGVVEGDDGLFRIEGKVPEASDFAKLGLIIKCEEHNSLSTASFCGLIFDEEDLVNVTDPTKVLASTGWISGKYAKSRKGVHLDLLRCKGMSLAHQYQGCPVITSLARYILRATRGRDLRRVLQMRHWSAYDREWYEEILKTKQDKIAWKEPPANTRLLVEKMFGISWEAQLQIEAYLDSLDEVQVLDMTILNFPEAWFVYSERYCMNVNSRHMDDPTTSWYQRRGVGSIDRIVYERNGARGESHVKKRTVH